MIIDHIAMTLLSFYMLLLFWWKIILIILFLFFRRNYLFHKLRFAIFGFFICYAIDMVIPRITHFAFNHFLGPTNATAQASIWMIATLTLKIIIAFICLSFLSKYYEKEIRLGNKDISNRDMRFSFSKLLSDEPIRYGTIVGIIGCFIAAVLMIKSINRSTSSTAAIGYLFVPMNSLLYSIPFFMFGYSIGYLKKWRASLQRKMDFSVALALITSITILFAGANFAIKGILLKNLVRQVKSMNAEDLKKTLENSFFGENKFVLAAIAQNELASEEILDAIARINDSDLYEKMGSLFDIMGNNKKGLAVMRLVARNPNVLPETLEYLAKCSNDYVLGDVAGNKKTSVETLVRLGQRKNYLINWGLAQNPSTPSHLLRELALSEDEYTRSSVANNPNTSLEVLEKLSEDTVSAVRISAKKTLRILNNEK